MTLEDLLQRRCMTGLDADFGFDNGFRVVQFTPPGSGCSIQFGAGMTSAAPGSAHGLYLVVSDIEVAQAKLVERGVEASPVQHMNDGLWVEGRGAKWNSFVFFQ